MRIHKTAGEALATQIRARLPAEMVCPQQFEWEVRNLPRETLRQFAFFQGHISPAALSCAIPSLRVFTMLRAPRQRLLSCYFYWKHGAQRASGEFFQAVAPLSLLEFLRSEQPIVWRATWNVQARLLAGGTFGDVDQHRQNVFGPSLLETELAAAAIGALDRFAFVGTAECYEQALAKAFALLGLGAAPPPVRLNETQPKPDNYDELLANREIADALARLTGADQMLYDAVVARL